MERFAKKRDILLMATLLLISAMVLLTVRVFNNQAELETAFVEKDGKIIHEVSMRELDEPVEITVEGDVSVTVMVDSESAKVTFAECPDQLCVKTGKLTKNGQCAVCLPARVSLRVVGNGEKDIDAVTG